jgi:glucose-6-phosphate 1-dehydrogenase
MLQNHLMQLLTLVAWSRRRRWKPMPLRDEKVKVLRSIRPISRRSVHAHAFRAQYKAGQSAPGQVPGYQDELGVDPNSVTETFAAAKFYIDNWRWRGVPFYLRTGKRMAEASSAITIRFKEPPHHLFRNTHLERINPNWLLMGIQPNECLKMEIQVKVHGLEMRTRTISLDASYRSKDDKESDAYEELLLDTMKGDHSLFLRYDEVEWAWRVVDPTWGPRGTYRLFDRDDQFWRHKLSVDGSDVGSEAY